MKYIFAYKSLYLSLSRSIYLFYSVQYEKIYLIVMKYMQGLCIINVIIMFFLCLDRKMLVMQMWKLCYKLYHVIDVRSTLFPRNHATKNEKNTLLAYTQ